MYNYAALNIPASKAQAEPVCWSTLTTEDFHVIPGKYPTRLYFNQPHTPSKLVQRKYQYFEICVIKYTVSFHSRYIKVWTCTAELCSENGELKNAATTLVIVVVT